MGPIGACGGACGGVTPRPGGLDGGIGACTVGYGVKRGSRWPPARTFSPDAGSAGGVGVAAAGVGVDAAGVTDPGVIWGTVISYAVLVVVPYAFYTPMLIRRLQNRPPPTTASSE